MSTNVVTENFAYNSSCQMVYYYLEIGKGVTAMDNDGLTQYTRIAISLAERIASGQLKEGDKISGRSKLSPE